MSDEQFTNRHGHTISALQEAVKALPEPEYRAAEAPAKPVRRRKRPAFRLSALQLRVIIILLAIVVLIPVVVGEYVRGTYGGNIDSAKNSVKSLFSNELSQQKTPLTSKMLSDVDTQLSTIRDRLCPGGFLDNLAKLYPRAQQAYNDCASYRSSVVALEEELSGAVAQMVYLEQLQPLLGDVSAPLEDQFAVLSSQQENWQTFVDKLHQMSVPASFVSPHAALVANATEIRDQWIALVQSSNVLDSTAYSAARTKLTDGYTIFKAQTTLFTDVVAASQASVSAAVKVLQ